MDPYEHPYNATYQLQRSLFKPKQAHGIVSNFQVKQASVA